MLRETIKFLYKTKKEIKFQFKFATSSDDGLSTLASAMLNLPKEKPSLLYIGGRRKDS